ncbi:hypothetical protein [Rhodoferax sp. BLA1]|uniref:hypothetical protein n=1 Tax=Rhodoferax sp. BLA1 TaxID=2576062 RepID=UPI0015D3505A|nr:hypothetical protein [Rhodoferax sp. BLA1]
MNPLKMHLQSAPNSMVGLSREEVTAMHVDVRHELLKDYVKGVQWRLTGPAPTPVFMPELALLLLPSQPPKTA